MDVSFIPSEDELILWIKKKIRLRVIGFHEKRKEAKKYKTSLWDRIKNEARK